MAQVEYTGPITPLGNLTFGAGLTAAFSGSDSKAQAQCARGVNQNTTPNFIGGTPTDNIPRAWSGFRLFGPNASKLVEHDAAGVSRTVELRDENNNLIATASAVDQTAQVWENMSFSAPAPFVSPRVVLQGTVGTTGDGMDVARLHLFYQNDGSAPPPPPPTTPPPSPTPQSPGTPIDWTIAIGQSEIVGPAPFQDSTAYYYAPGCVNFTNAHQIIPATEPLNPLNDTQGTPFESGRMGPTMAYLDERAKLVPGRRAGMLLRGHGSTALGAFAPGSQMYQLTVADALLALSLSPAGSRIVGVILQQGESGPSSGWDTICLSIINGYRQDLSLPNLPFVFSVVDARFSATAQVQRGMLLPFNVSRFGIDDLPVPASGDLVDPLTFRTIGKRFCWSIMGMG